MAGSVSPSWAPLGEGDRFDPEPDAGIREQFPRKFFAGINVARRRYIGMRQHAVGRHIVPCQDAAAQCCHRRNLPPGKIRISVLVTAISDLDPN